MLVLLLLLQNMGIEYDEAMETIHVIKRDGSVSSISPHRDNFEASANRIHACSPATVYSHWGGWHATLCS